MRIGLKLNIPMHNYHSNRAGKFFLAAYIVQDDFGLINLAARKSIQKLLQKIQPGW